MPRLLAAKQYPGLVDVYEQISTQDPINGEVKRVWDYDSPATYGCNFFSLRGHAEKFGETYASEDAVKLEVRPEDGSFIDLTMRFANLRMRLDESEEYYAWAGTRTSNAKRNVFNIDGMKHQVDNLGRVVCVEVYGVLAVES